MSKNQEKLGSFTHFKKIDESDNYQAPGKNTEDRTSSITKSNILKEKNSSNVIKGK
jgi:hypothetical protein